MGIQFENSVPILRVSSLARSKSYYVENLGFKVDWEYGGMASVSRGQSAVMLCEGAQGSPGTWVWMGVSDAQELFGEYQTKGARIAMEPANFSWALEFRIEDPDGHILRFGSDPLKERPYKDEIS